MKILAFALIQLSATTLACANVYVPKAKLAGETVYARLSKESASVTAVFEFEEWFTQDAKIVYFPVFATEAVDPITVLSRAEIEFEVGDKKVGVASPCEAPKGLKQALAGAHIYWFSANLNDLVDGAELESSGRTIVRFSYSQPLISGRFYYLPIIAGSSDGAASWKYQMLVRSESKPVRVTSKGTEFYQLADVVSVYLKDREIVEIR
jgi:hypothetical protein